MPATTVPVDSSLRSLRLECVPWSARQARKWVCEVVAGWGLDDLVDTAALVVSELAANAVEHTASAFMDVVLTREDASSVRVAVVDRLAAVSPRPLVTGVWGESGRGLALVEAVAARWGVAPVLPDAKCVFAVVGEDGDGDVR